jgi:hypothetical protein
VGARVPIFEEKFHGGDAREGAPNLGRMSLAGVMRGDRRGEGPLIWEAGPPRGGISQGRVGAGAYH